MTLSPLEIGTGLGAALATFAALWQTRKAEKNKLEAANAKEVAIQAQKRLDTVSSDDLAKKNQEIAEAYKLKAEEWKSAWEKEHAEKLDYSKRVHDQRELANAEHLKLIEENAKLQARTDLTPIIDHIERQSATNERVAEALTSLTLVIQGFVEKMPHEKHRTNET